MRISAKSDGSFALPDSYKKVFSALRLTSAAKAVAENKLVIAAVNRCATQRQVLALVFSSL
jgi:hypothetical protein